MKRNRKHRIWSGMLNISLLFTILIVSILCQVVSPVLSDSSVCGRLKSSTPRFVNSSLELRQGNIIGNLAEEYLTSEKSWNISAYWEVESSCDLKACDDVYLTGNCQTFSNGISSPVGKWISAECKCARSCTCSDIHLKRSVCARAYIKPGNGCDSCDSPYTELVPTTSLQGFAEDWTDQVVSLLVRRGCTLDLYEREDGDGDSETMEGPTYKEWTSHVGSYECDCDDKEYEPEVVSPLSTTSVIPSLEIPSTLDDVVTKFSEHNFGHPGLLAAFTSLMHRRSARNAYILTIGSTGSGKSSGINILVGQPNMTIAGDHKSTTSEILEFRIPLSLPELGISNSELRIIDTPGMGDTRGPKYDAMFLATLDDYLSDHEELQKRIPNLVLIFHKFSDNRFDGESAEFVKMLRALNAFRNRITDENYSNVIFVFSHYSAVGRQSQKNPHPRLMMFKEVIEKFSLFPKPIMTTVIENKGAENELVLKNDNFELPNGEFYPQNLIRRMETVTKSAKDKIGNAIVVAAFINKRLGEELFPETRRYDLINSTTHSKVTKYLSILQAASHSMGITEVSKLLEEAYKAMSSSLKAVNPSCLEDLQRNLHVRNIHSKSDLPQTGHAILGLLNELGHNEANAYLLEHGLNLKAPAFPSSTVAGYSYSLIKDSVLSATPFKLAELKASPIGFLTPVGLQCMKADGESLPQNKFVTFNSKQDYYDFRLRKSLGSDLSKEVNSTETFNAITGKIKDGYFVKEISCVDVNGICSFVVPSDYKRFEFRLGVRHNRRAELSPEFIQHVTDLKEFNQSDHENVDKWKRFFSDYGTHVIVGANGGGRIQFRFSIPSETSPETEVVKSVEFLDNLLPSVLKYRQNPKEIIANASKIAHTLVFNGGSQAYHISDLSKITLEEAVHLFQKWKKSLDLYPAVFPTAAVNILEVIEHFISKTAAEKFKEPFNHLLKSSLVYIPPPPPTPDPKVLEEIARQQKEIQERIEELEKEKIRKAEEAERQRLADIQAQKQREREWAEEMERRRQELEEAEERRKAEEEEEQRRFQEEQERIKKEMEEEKQRHLEELKRIEEEAKRHKGWGRHRRPHHHHRHPHDGSHGPHSHHHHHRHFHNGSDGSHHHHHHRHSHGRRGRRRHQEES